MIVPRAHFIHIYMDILYIGYTRTYTRSLGVDDKDSHVHNTDQASTHSVRNDCGNPDIR